MRPARASPFVVGSVLFIGIGVVLGWWFVPRYYYETTDGSGRAFVSSRMARIDGGTTIITFQQPQNAKVEEVFCPSYFETEFQFVHGNGKALTKSQSVYETTQVGQTVELFYTVRCQYRESDKCLVAAEFTYRRHEPLKNACEPIEMKPTGNAE